LPFVRRLVAGSFIFLTIENEDSALLHQQHTLASTKRNLAGLGIGNSIYQQRTPQQHQQQQQQQHQAVQGRHADNDTVAAAAAAVAAQGMLAGNANTGGPNPFGPASSGDFVYGMDGLDAADLEAAGMPQFALSPDTYDVRQRTIENIWDITVSLNILYKENWTK